MGWPTDIPFSPTVYQSIFTGNVDDPTSNRGKLQLWADDNLVLGGQHLYSLGHFIRFLMEKGHELSPPFSATPQQATDWLNLLTQWFGALPVNQKNRVENVIKRFLKHRKQITLEIVDAPWQPPVTTDPDDQNDGFIRITSRRRPRGAPLKPAKKGGGKKKAAKKKAGKKKATKKGAKKKGGKKKGGRKNRSRRRK